MMPVAIYHFSRKDEYTFRIGILKFGGDTNFSYIFASRVLWGKEEEWSFFSVSRLSFFYCCVFREGEEKLSKSRSSTPLKTKKKEFFPLKKSFEYVKGLTSHTYSKELSNITHTEGCHIFFDLSFDFRPAETRTNLVKNHVRLS